MTEIHGDPAREIIESALAPNLSRWVSGDVANRILEALRSRGYAVTRIEDEALRACSASPREKLVAAALRAKCLEIFGSTWSNDAAVQLARAALDVVDE
jgi:hypothetical protein